MPTQQEIADHFEFRSRNSVAEHLRLIRQKGFLESATGKARSLRITSALTKLSNAMLPGEAEPRGAPSTVIGAGNDGSKTVEAP